MLQVLSNSFPCGAFLHRIGKLDSDRCRLCQKLGAGRPKEGIARETVGHIQSARCLGQREVVIAAHNRCVRTIIKEVQKGGHRSTELQVITEDGECSMTTLWQRLELLEICEWEQVKQAAWAARMERLGQQGTRMECNDEGSNDMWVCEPRNTIRCAAGEKVERARKWECGAVDAGRQGGGVSRGKRGKNAGGQAWINYVSRGEE